MRTRIVPQNDHNRRIQFPKLFGGHVITLGCGSINEWIVMWMDDGSGGSWSRPTSNDCSLSWAFSWITINNMQTLIYTHSLHTPCCTSLLSTHCTHTMHSYYLFMDNWITVNNMQTLIYNLPHSLHTPCCTSLLSTHCTHTMHINECTLFDLFDLFDDY